MKLKAWTIIRTLSCENSEMWGKVHGESNEVREQRSQKQDHQRIKAECSILGHECAVEVSHFLSSIWQNIPQLAALFSLFSLFSLSHLSPLSLYSSVFVFFDLLVFLPSIKSCAEKEARVAS